MLCVPISFGNEAKIYAQDVGVRPGGLPMESATEGTSAKNL
jgi:hypothetical protein